MRPPLQRRERGGGVDVNHGIELVCNPRMKVVARAFGFGLIDDANRAFEPRGERIPRRGRWQDEPFKVCMVEQAFVAPGSRSSHTPPLGGLVPFSRGGHGAAMCRK